VELTQGLNDKKTELKENRNTMDRSQAEHDKLRLVDVEYASFLSSRSFQFSFIGSDEEDEDEEHQGGDGNVQEGHGHEGQVSSTNGGREESDANPVVKTEEGYEPAPNKKSRQPHKPPSNELHIYSAAELSRLNQRELLADVQLLDGLLILVTSHTCSLIFVSPEQLKRTRPNMAVLKEYQRREEEFLRRAKDLDETTALRDAEKQKYDSLRKQRLDEFMAGFSTISLKLKEMYQVSAVFSQLPQLPNEIPGR
jgi:structural maintenance of chromosome 4